jgi:hypothetical protein
LKKVTKAFLFILVSGFIIYLAISRFDKLNGFIIIGFSPGLLISIYCFFIAATDKSVDFKDGLRIKKI